MEVKSDDDMAVLFQRRLRDSGYQCTVNYVGRGWYRIRKVGALGEGIKRRAADIVKMIKE